MNLIALMTVLIVTFTVILIGGFWVLLQSKRPFAIWGKKGIMIFKLDPITRNVSPYKLDQLYNGRSKVSSWFTTNYKGHSSNILKLFGLIVNNPQGGKLFRNALHKIGNGDEEVHYDFIAKNIKVGKESIKIRFNFIIRKIVDVSDYLMIIDWKVISDNQKSLSNAKIIPIDNVIHKQAPFKGFITFDLNERVPFVREKFIHEIRDILKPQHYDIFAWSNLMIVVCYAKKNKSIKKKTMRFIKFVNNKKRKIGIAQFIDASGSARFQGINNKKDMNKALATLEFITNLSLRWNEPFVDLRTAQNFKQEFITYNDAAKKFRELIRLHDFKTKLLPIKNRKSQRKIIDYYVPDLESFDKYEIKNILLNNYNRKKLVDANIEKIIAYQNVEESILIDVNSSWLIDNASKLFKGKICYIIQIDDYSFVNKVTHIISDLIIKGFLIGLRIDSFSQFFITFIQKIKPSLVIIDQKIIQENPLTNTIHYTRLFSLKNIFETNNIKVIFENWSPQITNQLAAKLGINFYFNH